VVGWDQNRLSMVLAVLEAHGGLRLGMHDVYLNVAGGLRITEPAADLAAAAALVSSLSGSPLPPDTVYFGEVGLSGAIRPVAQAPARMKEAAKLGFASAVAPAPRGEAKGERSPLATASIGHIADLVAGVASTRPRGNPSLRRREG
jgi:DNA repair protein RadA/Sms